MSKELSFPGAYKVGQKVAWLDDDGIDPPHTYYGTITEVRDDGLKIDFPEINDHCLFDDIEYANETLTII